MSVESHEALMQKIADLEAQLAKANAALAKEKPALKHKEASIVLTKEMEATQKKGVLNLFVYLKNSPILGLMSAPVIYAVLFPAIILDVSVTIYQWIAFPLNKIDIVKRSDYIIYDRFGLKYLNILEKFACLYCSYVNGLFAYASEIGARTEQNFCPIRHKKEPKYYHGRYKNFFEYGDHIAYKNEIDGLRKQLKKTKEEA